MHRKKIIKENKLKVAQIKKGRDDGFHPPSPSKVTPFCSGGLVRPKTFFILLPGVAHSVSRSESSFLSQGRDDGFFVCARGGKAREVDGKKEMRTERFGCRESEGVWETELTGISG